jgi:spore maturation protein CgeB
MRIVLFCHSLLSDWNHGAAHFLRGVVSDLLDRWHNVTIYEPHDAWSLKTLHAGGGEGSLPRFHEICPKLKSNRYRLEQLDLDEALDGVDLVIAHKWNGQELIRRIGEHRARTRNYRLLFHDTHHRSGNEVNGVAAYDLSNYDGALVFGEMIRDRYLSRGWTERAWVWREAADMRIFYPRTMSVGAESGKCDGRETGIKEASGKNSPHQPIAPASVPAIRFSALPALSATNFRGDLVLVGNWADDQRAETLREFLIEPVRQSNLKTRVHGACFPEQARRMLARAGIEFAGWAPQRHMPQLFANFKFTVHIPRPCSSADLQGVPSMRMFEALACGIPLVSAPWDDAENLFTLNKDYLAPRDGEEMKRSLSALLADEDMRNELSEQGLRTILNRHTCTHRVNELLKICAELQVNSLDPLAEIGRGHRVAAGGRR